MTLQIDKKKARSILEEEGAECDALDLSGRWVALIEKLSDACERSSRTPIAYLGTAILAKCVEPAVDVFSLKAKSGHPGAFSARGLCHGVLVPASLELGFSLGVNGREPLNNQPFFRYDRVSREMDVKGAAARSALALLCDVLQELDHVVAREEVRMALRCFVYVRKAYVPNYGDYASPDVLESASEFAEIVDAFVGNNSEGGRRAQAVAAGLMDLLYGSDRVESGRVNDPDRALPGDVGVRAFSERVDEGARADSGKGSGGGSVTGDWERVFEVRDKPVTRSDVQVFVSKVAKASVQKAGLLAIGEKQTSFHGEELEEWAEERGVMLSIYSDWSSFVHEAVFWSGAAGPIAISRAHARVHARLKELEVSAEAVDQWLHLGKL